MGEEELSANPAAMKQDEFIIDAKEFFEANKTSIGAVIKRGGKIIHIDFEDISAHSPEISEMLIERPEEAIQLLEIALQELEWAPSLPKIRLNTLSGTQELLIRNIRARHLAKMIAVEGIVRQAGEVRPKVTNAKFECPSCGTIISVLQIDKKFKEPTRCSCGRRGSFKELSKEMVDAQVLVIEEASDNLSGGEQPKRINIFLQEDLVDPTMEMRTTPGSRVKIIGVLKEIALSSASGGKLTRFDIAIEANNILPLDESFEDIEISEEDEREIRDLAKDPEIIKKMVKSIAPSIWGHNEVKKALAFQLFGGVKKTRSDGTSMRGDIHVLLVGDPGVAKSVMLGFISQIAPKARYVSGKSATGAGLTATVVKDELLKGWALEAGAMVLANKGLVAIDEFDKMDEEDRSTMHEAMEQQCMLPNFKLMLSNGKSVEIGSLVDGLMKKNKKEVIQGKDCEILPVSNVELLSTDFKHHFPMKADRISRHIAPKEFVKITLASGREITVTPEHPCWIVEDGNIKTIPAEKLKENMFFPVPSKLDIKTKKYERKNDYLCKILGYHISDGCYELNRGKKNGIQFWNNNEVLINDYKNCIEKYFKIKPGITRRGKQFAVRVVSKKVVNEFMKIDPSLMEKCRYNKIPEEVMSLPNENIRYLIRALFDGDGTVVNQTRGGCRATLAGENREMLEQVSDLLLRFEIQSSIFRDESSNIWRLDISGQDNLSRYLINISFLSSHKKARLKGYCEKAKTYRTIRDLIPGCTTKISKIYKKIGISMNKELGHSIDLGVEKQRLYLQKLVLIAEKYLTKNTDKNTIRDLDDIKKLAFGYARWTKIKNKGTKWVYDVTIEPHHTFISNGMVLHNTITISKATVQATLRAQTSVLAAANPKYGRFDPDQPIPKQVNLAPSLLSRFDAIFIMRDIPSTKNDTAIALHVLKEHQQTASHDVIDKDLLKKYISYSKQKVNPVLTEEAIEEMKNFYVGLRNQIQSSSGPIKPIPIGARQLEAMVRLAEAHARIKLRKKVSVEDAQEAIKLVRAYLLEVGYDKETDTIDIDRISGTSASKRGKIVTVREVITGLSQKMGKLIPEDEIEKALDGKISKIDLEEAIQKLLKSGDLFRPKRGFFQLM